MISAIQTALSGLQSSSLKLNASASNIANVSTVGSLDDPDNAPYTPLTTTSESINDPGGVLTQITPQEPAFTPAFDPDSPFANQDGFIGVPNVDLAEESVNLKIAELSYKANLKTIEVVNDLFDELLETVDQDA